MLASILFFSGLGVMLIILVITLNPSSYLEKYLRIEKETKTEILVLPFFLLLAAAVGRYIGF